MKQDLKAIQDTLEDQSKLLHLLTNYVRNLDKMYRELRDKVEGEKK